MPPEHDDFLDLPGLRRFGDELAAAGRAAEARRRRRWSLRRSLGAGIVVLTGVGTTAAATAVTLRGTVIPAPDPRIVPTAQAPVAHTTIVATPRSADPAGGPAWALRLTRSRGGLTCSAVGQVNAGSFGIVGQDGLFRPVPPAISDACGRRLLLGARLVDDVNPQRLRSVVYGVAGEGTRRVVLRTIRGAVQLQVGSGGTFVAALRGYPEDNGVRISITNASGRTQTHAIGTGRGLVTDLDGAPAWALETLTLGTRARCARMVDARADLRATTGTGPNGNRASVPTACLDPRTNTAWAAYAQRFHRGQGGVPGFDRWDYRQRPARTIVLGVVRRAETVRSITVGGNAMPRPRTIRPSYRGAFGLVLPPTVDPRRLTITVNMLDGRALHGRPGDGLIPDLVPSRRNR